MAAMRSRCSSLGSKVCATVGASRAATWRTASKSRNGHHRVRLASGWSVVPDQAVVQGPNHYHKAVVWLWNEEALKDEWGAIPASPIHCFLPGTGV